MKNSKNLETLFTIIVYKSFHFDGKNHLKNHENFIFTVNPFILLAKKSRKKSMNFLTFYF